MSIGLFRLKRGSHHFERAVLIYSWGQILRSIAIGGDIGPAPVLEFAHSQKRKRVPLVHTGLSVTTGALLACFCLIHSHF